MADYSASNISALYGTILGLSSGAISGTLKTVQDGNGSDSALQVSTAGVKSTGTLESTGAATIGGACSATSFTGDASGMSNVRSAVFANRTATTNANISDGDELLIMNGSSLSVTVPTAADVDGKSYVIVNKASTAVTIVTGGETIIGSGTTSTSDRTLAAYSSVTIVSANNEFYIIAGSAT